MMIRLLKPEQNSSVNLLPEGPAALRAGARVDGASDELDWRCPELDGTERSYPLPVRFAWAYEGETAEARLLIADNEAFEDAREVVCTATDAELRNFMIGQRYYWRVRVGDWMSEVGTFVTDSMAPRMLCVPGLTNVRDVGGWVNVDGKRIRQNMIYRGSEMDSHHTLTDEGRRVLLEELKLRTDFDLRRDAEVEGLTPPLDGQAGYIRIPLNSYDEFFEEQFREGICRIFEHLTDRSLYPMYVHCWGGADRTGTLVMMFQAVLGLDDELMMQDYELTSFAIWGKRSRTSKQFVSLLNKLEEYGAADEPLRIKCVRFLKSIGVPQAHLDTFRRIMLEE